MWNVKDFLRVAEVRVTTGPEEFRSLKLEGWVELGVMLIPPSMACVIPAIKGEYIGYVIALGRLEEKERSFGEETWINPDPDAINAKLKEGWVFTGIVTGTTTAFAHHGYYFASSFVLSH